MVDVYDMFKNQLDKMGNDGSWLVGMATGAISIVIPNWIYQKEWSMYHSVLILMLL